MEILKISIGCEILCYVDQKYILDQSNLQGIQKYVPNLLKTMQYVMGVASDSEEMEDLENTIEIEESAQIFYALIHERYIQTEPGMIEIVYFLGIIKNSF